MTPSGRQQVIAFVVTAAGVLLMIGLSMLLRSRASWSLDLPVNPIPAVFGALMLVYYAAVVGLEPHHIVIWGGLLVAGAPAGVGRRRAQQHRPRSCRGVAVMLNGVFDHLALVRTLGAATPSLGRG